MNFIETITQAEKAANDMCVHAHEESKIIIEGAQSAQKQALEKQSELLGETRNQKREAQKEDLKATYREILSRGIAEAEAIKVAATKKAPEAISFITKNL